MSRISTHILDTAKGRPVGGIEVRVFLVDEEIGRNVTDADGRVRNLVREEVDLAPGTYRLLFRIGNYFPSGFYPEVSISFAVRNGSDDYHVPLLISPYGYTTYRGS